MASNITQITEKEFPAEMAGEAVGFITAGSTPEEERLRTVSVSVAEVGIDGAKYEVLEVDQGESGRFITSRALGFVANVGYEITVDRDVHAQGRLLGNYFAQTDRDPARHSYHDQQNSLQLSNGPTSFEGLAHDLGEWAIGPDAIIETLRSALDKNDADWLYAHLYYQLNAALGVEQLLADPEMHHITKRQIGNLKHFCGLMYELELGDHKAIDAIDEAESLEEGAFIELRTRAAQIEQKAHAKIIDGMIPHGLIPASGQLARTWPYMDAMAATPHEQYGTELAQLRAGDFEPVRSELLNELREVRWRREFANAIRVKFDSLAVKEELLQN